MSASCRQPSHLTIFCVEIVIVICIICTLTMIDWQWSSYLSYTFAILILKCNVAPPKSIIAFSFLNVSHLPPPLLLKHLLCRNCHRYLHILQVLHWLTVIILIKIIIENIISFSSSTLFLISKCNVAPPKSIIAFSFLNVSQLPPAFSLNHLLSRYCHHLQVDHDWVTVTVIIHKHC